MKYTDYIGYEEYYGGILRNVENDKYAIKLDRKLECASFDEAMRGKCWSEIEGDQNYEIHRRAD